MSDTVVESPIRIFLMIENRLLREALCRLFHKRTDLQVVGQSDHNSPPESLEDLCDVLALDSFDPEQPVSFFSPETCPSRFKTVLIGMRDDSAHFMEAVRAGVSGYLLKDASASDVVSAIRGSFKGEAVCPPRLCATLFEHFAQAAREGQTRPFASRRADLTMRQQQLVGLVAKGLTNKEIAVQLNLSEFTVRNHIHRIMKQVDVGSRQEAVRVVRIQGLSANA